MFTNHRRRKRGGRVGGIIPPPPKFQVGFFFVFACHPGGRCCVPRVPLPNNVNDVRKLFGEKMGGSPPPPAHQLFLGVTRATLYFLRPGARAKTTPVPPPPPPLNFCASAANVTNDTVL